MRQASDGKRAKWDSWGAFTLVELLVVISIIALLVSILLPSLSAARDQAKAVVCLSNTKNVGMAVTHYSSADRNGGYPASYLYPYDERGNWSPARQDTNHAYGYLHWSYALFNKGAIDTKAFSCPKFENGGAPRTNPGPAPEDWEPEQVDQNGAMGPNLLQDRQAPRMSLAANAAIIPRNKFTRALSGGNRVNKFTNDSVIKRPQGTILATEYINNWKALGIDEGGSGVLSKSHRPINPFYHLGSGFNEYEAIQDSPGFIYGLVSRPKTPEDYGLIPREAAERQTNVLDHTSGVSQVNAVGRHHPGGGENRKKWGGTANFLFCDGHAERRTILETLQKRMWGDHYYTLSGSNEVLNFVPPPQ
ncbi:MAG TPA: type II secretion system protein [Phycisphaerae bacterium]|nr:type II secretion system protein [Phycisphaerae bacterium]HNU47111.1 type II secretion system protein [Phycisphaerae bacterium]